VHRVMSSRVRALK